MPRGFPASLALHERHLRDDVMPFRMRHCVDRRGNPIPVVMANLPAKVPFHLPRALIYSILSLRALTG